MPFRFPPLEPEEIREAIAKKDLKPTPGNALAYTLYNSLDTPQAEVPVRQQLIRPHTSHSTFYFHPHADAPTLNRTSSNC
jgi:hypothetical protein